MYNPVKLSSRISALKNDYKSLPVPLETNPYVDKKYRKFCTGDRWMTLGYLHGWLNHSDAITTKLRHSYAEAQELIEAQPVIMDNELLLGHLYLPEYSKAQQEEYEKLCDAFVMSNHTLVERPPRKDHISLDYEKLVKKGINGVIAEIEEKLSALNKNDVNIYPEYEEIKKREFYNCCLIELNAVLDLAKRYSEAALKLSEEKPEPRKSELKIMGEMLKNVPANPAQSFWEAVQSVQFFMSGLFGLYPLGKPDRYLYELYEKDIASGKMTRELAQEIIDNFCLSISDRVFTRAACGFIVGGRDKNGRLVENELTYMFITAMDHLQLPDPNGALAVCDETSDDILAYAVEVLSHGTSHPAFYNDKAISSSLIENYNVTPQDATEYIHSTCAEMSISGKGRSHSTPFMIDLPRILMEIARKYPDIDNIKTLFEKYYEEIANTLKNKAYDYVTRMLEASRNGNEEAVRICAFIDDCIERGKGLYEGGERYCFVQPILVGFSTAVDSLIALDKLCFTDKKMSLCEFTKIADDDFKDNEVLREYIIKRLPHYGNDDSFADKMADDFAAVIKSVFANEKMPMGAQMMPGTFTYINHAFLGSQMTATFDGRKAYYSYSDGCSATQGRDTNGPTAMIMSLTSWNQSRLLGGMVVNIKFGKEMLSGQKKNNIIALLRVFMQRGGVEIQVNVVDRETLEDARKNPDAHADLLVRIGGYSDYFIRLTPALQQEIIDRTEY